MNQSDNITRGKAIGFLVWLHNYYGLWCTDTYCAMADKYKQCNYGTCRNLLRELINAGYITVVNPKSHKRKYHINAERFNKLVSLSATTL